MSLLLKSLKKADEESRQPSEAAETPAAAPGVAGAAPAASAASGGVFFHRHCAFRIGGSGIGGVY